MEFVGTPLLYENMSLSQYRLHKLVSTLSVSGPHRGLAHVRNLSIEVKLSWTVIDHDNAEYTLDLCGLLRAIPRNALTRFE
jgi:hypothetical protein